jgi:hypothetical protein
VNRILADILPVITDADLRTAVESAVENLKVMFDVPVSRYHIVAMIAKKSSGRDNRVQAAIRRLFDGFHLGNLYRDLLSPSLAPMLEHYLSVPQPRQDAPGGATAVLVEPHSRISTNVPKSNPQPLIGVSSTVLPVGRPISKMLKTLHDSGLAIPKLVNLTEIVGREILTFINTADSYLKAEGDSEQARIRALQIALLPLDPEALKISDQVFLSREDLESFVRLRTGVAQRQISRADLVEVVRLVVSGIRSGETQSSIVSRFYALFAETLRLCIKIPLAQQVGHFMTARHLRSTGSETRKGRTGRGTNATGDLVQEHPRYG